MKTGYYPLLRFLFLILFSWGCDSEKKEFIQPSPRIEEPRSINPNSFIIQWTPFPSVDFYLLDIALDSDFKVKLSEEYPVEVKETFYEVQDLDPSTIYYYRVGAQTISGSILKYSDTQEISTTALPSPLALEPISIGINQITAIWSEVEAADGYLLEVSSQIDFENIINTYESSSNQDTVLTITDLKEKQGYFYRVKSKRGSFYSIPSNVKYAITTQLDKPVITDSQDIQYTSATLYWEAVPQADAYEVEASADPLFDEHNTPTIIIKDIQNTQAKVEGLDGNTTYYFRLRAKQDTMYSAYSSTLKIKTKGLAAPDILEPTEIGASQFSANWVTVANAESYELDLATDIDFTSTLPEFNGLTTSDFTYTFTGLTPGTDYYLRIKAQGFNTYSDYSEIFVISTYPLEAPQSLEITTQVLNSFTLSWSEAEGAKSYLLSVAEDSSFNTVLSGYDLKEVIGNTWKVEGTDPLQKYYVRVVSKNGTVKSAGQAVLTVSASVPPNCLLSKKIWDDGWVESYTENAGQLISISGDSTNIARYNWELIYQDEQLVEANKYEEESPNILVLKEIWTFGYQNDQWVSLHRQDETNTTLDYTTLAYDSEGKVIQVSKYADHTKSTLNTQENYTYSGENIIEARNAANQLIKSWKYADHFNPNYQFSPQVNALLNDPTGSAILGFVSSSVTSFYQEFVTDTWENKAYIYDTNQVGMPTKLYSGNGFPTQTYIFQSCGF
ncbi:hypothetical protein OKW21_005214 [Catalinimonas alkaloidigena]|uniref:fibronectin type III domain-containing protein n=1 Tax=Catalinimonas alkaloidigena TaxID=1075417 RepID=UPI0024059039|nr:fibronectin type III domain-containing protein [Catalinimonas alkaloidigena]MDF9799951.1 hypothetical protein [Catalinimonas alkaloidigena]